MGLPNYITHYFEAEHGPFQNICDLNDHEVEKLVHEEKNARTAFNRFAMGPDFLTWRREADVSFDTGVFRKVRTSTGRPALLRPFGEL
jgi:hypothetical protein